MATNYLLKDWIMKYKNNEFDSKNVGVQCDAGWYDWFCNDQSLLGRLKRMAPKVIKISKSKNLDPNSTYVWFKNNCPCRGGLYDDFRFADAKTGNTLYTISPDNNGQSEVWGYENDFEKPLVEGSWKDVLLFFEV